MYGKVKKVVEEGFALIEDFKKYPELYAIMGGMIIYQLLTYFILGFVPFSILKIFTWSFFMLIFCLLLLVIETPITFTQLYHLSVITVVQLLLALEINLNPLYQAVIFVILLRRARQYIYDSLSTESLLPYALKDIKSNSSSREEVSLLYESCRCFLML